jgi:hypothetical protein
MRYMHSPKVGLQKDVAASAQKGKFATEVQVPVLVQAIGGTACGVTWCLVDAHCTEQSAKAPRSNRVIPRAVFERSVVLDEGAIV